MPAHTDVQPINIQPDWKTEYSQSITSAEALLAELQLDPAQLPISQKAAMAFALRVPRPFAQRMEIGNADDPLLRQVLPVAEETKPVQGYNRDPLQESNHNPVPGIVHKYRNRLLLIVSPNCAINCRYCFRRHFPYDENRQSKQQWQQALDYIGRHREINEVIYSGGDPMAANDNFLAWLTEQIDNILHIKRLRIHSRLPVVIPSRIDGRFLNWASNTRLRVIMVLHINHANELDETVAQAVGRLRDQNILVLNQTVLLKGINDNTDSLAALSEKLFDSGVMPYYLHILDPVQGASHFDLSLDMAMQLHRELKAKLPGFLVPNLVQEEPGKTSKTVLS